jgi:hypothetical protein
MRAVTWAPRRRTGPAAAALALFLLLAGACLVSETALSAEPGAYDLEQAKAEYQAAYRHYTELVTTGGTGSVEEALAAYRAAYQRYQALQRRAGEQTGRSGSQPADAAPTDTGSAAANEDRSSAIQAVVPGRLTALDAGILARALEFRSLAAAGIAAALAPPDCGAAFAAMLGPGAADDGSLAWAHFFDGTFVLLGTDASGTRVTAFYNPYYDAAVLVSWDDTVPEPRMRRAATVSGDRIRGDAAAGGAGLPGWLSTAGASSGGLSAQFARFVAAFERHYPPPGRASDAAELPVDDAASREGIQLLGDIQVAALLALRDRLLPALTALSLELRAALARGDENALTGLLPKENPVTAREILQLPELLRASLVPTQMLPGLGRALVVLADPRLPRFGLLVSVQTAPDVRIGRLVVFDLLGGAPQ